MDVVCGKCTTKIKIPDEKIQKVPPGQTFGIVCPKCKNKISVENKAAEPAAAKAAPPKPEKAPAPKAEKAAAPPPAEPSPPSESSSDEDEAPDSPFEFLEEGVETVLLCEPDAAARAKIKAALEGLKYRVSEPATHRDALKQMRFHDFNVVVLNERFGTRDPDMNHVLKHLEQLPMLARRNLFVALLTERFRTVDNMMAYNKSVNMVINMKDINDIQKIIGRGIKDNATFYRVIKETVKKIKG